MISDNRIISIENALAASQKALGGLTAEKENIVPQLEHARYINANMIHLIEQQYVDKIEYKQAEIDDMKLNLKKLKSYD